MNRSAPHREHARDALGSQLQSFMKREGLDADSIVAVADEREPESEALARWGSRPLENSADDQVLGRWMEFFSGLL